MAGRVLGRVIGGVEGVQDLGANIYEKPLALCVLGK